MVEAAGWAIFLAGAGLGAGAGALAAWMSSQRSGARDRRERLGRLAHDLRTPLSSITAYAEILQDDVSDPRERARFLEIISQEARRIDDLIGVRLDGAAGRNVAPAPAAVAASRGRRVLVVDDDRFLREATRTLLAREGYDALGAGGGQEALRQARERRPDLILMDLRMPGMSGDEALRRLRSDPVTRGIPVIVTTAEPGVPAPEGAAGMLTKPISREALLAAIESGARGGTGA